MDKSHQPGFTLVELMVTLAVASLLIIVAVPGTRDFLRNNRLTGGVNDLLHSIQVARTEAIKRQNGNVVVCGSSNPTAGNAAICNYTSLSGWIVFQDTNGNWQHETNGTEPMIEVHAALDTTVTVKADANDEIVSFGPSGFANPAGAKVPTATLLMCDARGVKQMGGSSTARALFITATGRARASALWNDVKNVALPLVVGGSCP